MQTDIIGLQKNRTIYTKKLKTEMINIDFNL